MEHINYQLVNNQRFSGFVTDPGGVAAADEKSIVQLLQKFPYSQILHTLHVKAFNVNTTEFDKHLATAALYATDRNVLFQTINNPDFFEHTVIGVTITNVLDEAPTEESPEGQKTELEDEIAAIDVSQEDISIGRVIGDEKPDAVEFEEEIIPEESSAAQVPLLITGNMDDSAVVTAQEETKANAQPAEDDVNNDLTVHPEVASGEPLETKRDETEKLIIGNIAATDYFRFERKLDDQKLSEPAAEPDIETEAQKEAVEMQDTPLQAIKDVSKYNDDKMPYTFLWWLSKTRQEHSATYQPYATFKPGTARRLKKNSGEELNQQIIENIFHLQSPLQLEENQHQATVQFELKKKEEAIIERFIKEEPQIKPPRPEKLDTENKARKSSEDTNDVVSETLAQIYIEQMLFHKAIETYRKLSLKFPEKSAYFADQINKLENR